MESSFILTRPFVYEVKANGDLEIKGDISTTDPDLVDDIVSLKCLKSMKQQIKDGNIKLDLEHESFRGDTHEEKEINKIRGKKTIFCMNFIRDKSTMNVLRLSKYFYRNTNKIYNFKL